MTAMAVTSKESRRWTLRVCNACGGHHQHYHDGCVTQSIEVMPVAEHERIVADLRSALDAASRTLGRALDGTT